MGRMTTHAAKLMVNPWGGIPTTCCIVGYCGTYVFKFRNAVANEPTNGPIYVQQREDYSIGLASNLPAYLERVGSHHYSINVSLQAEMRRMYDEAVTQCNQYPQPTAPLFIVIDKCARIEPTMLQSGECFTIDEYRDGKAIVKGGREGKKALIAIRTLDGSWPHSASDSDDLDRITVEIAMRIEPSASQSNMADQLEELHSGSCYVSSEGKAVYTLEPTLSAATGSVGAVRKPPTPHDVLAMLHRSIEYIEPIVEALRDSLFPRNLLVPQREVSWNNAR